MFSRRIIAQASRGYLRPPVTQSLTQPRAVTCSLHFTRSFSDSNQVSGSNKKPSSDSTDPEATSTSNPVSGIKRKPSVNPAANIADRVKASFQKGGLLQRQSSQNSIRNRNSSYGGQGPSGGGGRNDVNARGTTSQQLNTGGGGGSGGKQQPRKQQPSNNRVNGAAPKQTPPQKRTVQRGRVQDTPKAVPSPDMYDDADSDDEERVVSGGMSPYDQKQLHLKHKREQFERDLVKDKPVKYVKTPDASNPPIVNDPFLKVKTPQSIAEMKALAEQRLADKIENPVENTWIDYKEIRKQKRRDRMNKIKEKNKILKEQKWGKKTTESAGTIIYEIKIPHNGLTVRELSQRLSMKMTDTIQKLADIGEIVDVNAEGIENLLIDPDVIELLAMDLNLTATRQEAIYRDASEYIKKSNRVRSDAVLAPRSPIISVMGHVDHGKTTLLDKLREADAAAGEAGGITQKLSAFNVEMGGRSAVFLDTPGHAAFTGMRKSGATGSDLVVLVVAIEDGVRPLTIEAAKVASKSGCTIVVALTKVDKITDDKEREAARRKALTGLMEVDIIAEEFGGDVQVVEVSAKTGEGVADLVEKLLLQADIMELQASETGGAEGVVLDAKIEKGRGVMVDLLVKWGTLKVGDAVVVSNAYGKVKAMLNDKGKPIKSAGPSTPIRLLGLNSIPAAGQDIIGVENESKARKIADRRQRLEDARRIKELNRRAQAIEAEEDPIVIPVILKADSAGGLNALRTITDALSERTDDVIIHIIGSSIGDVTPSDLSLAKLVKDSPPATILGFNINSPNNSIRTSAKQNDVLISTDSVIYRLEEVLEDVMKSHMPVERVATLEGTANVLQMFSYKISPSKMRKVAGVDVVSGAMRETSNHFFRVIRGEDILLQESTGAQLKRFKDTVHEVKSGFECGLSLDDFENIQPGDRIECYKFENVQKELIVHSNNKVSYAPLKKKKDEEEADEEDS